MGKCGGCLILAPGFRQWPRTGSLEQVRGQRGACLLTFPPALPLPHLPGSISVSEAPAAPACGVTFGDELATGRGARQGTVVQPASTAVPSSASHSPPSGWPIVTMGFYFPIQQQYVQGDMAPQSLPSPGFYKNKREDPKRRALGPGPSHTL